MGLYLAAPEHALVLCCDEKSQVQALDRTQPGLPLKKGRASTFTHDYVRHGTTTLFAALNVADGTVIGQCQSRHRHLEWLKFLRLLDAQTPADRDLHLILDNYATHKHPKGQSLAPKASTLSPALHSDQRLVAQHGGALLSRTDHQAPAPGSLSQSARVDHSDHCAPCKLQR